jgi:hypothetical protein
MVKGELRNKKFPWKPERHKKISQNAYIQSFRDFFHKSTGSSSPSASSLGSGISTSQAGNMQ